MSHILSCPSLCAPPRLVAHASAIEEVWHFYDSHSALESQGTCSDDLRRYGLHNFQPFRPPKAQGKSGQGNKGNTTSTRRQKVK